MGDRERLFRVIVLGGIGMLGVAVQATACDGTTSTSPTDAGSWSSGSSSGFPMEGASSGSFPTEGTRFQPEPDGEAPIEDAGGDVMDASLVDAGEKRFVVGAGEQEARAETVRFRHALRRTGTTERGPIWHSGGRSGIGVGVTGARPKARPFHHAVVSPRGLPTRCA